MFHYRARIDFCAEQQPEVPAGNVASKSRLIALRCLQRIAASRRFTAAIILILLTGLEATSLGAGPLPGTPCPCAADGICRPNRSSWGYSQTRWRTWPGELADQTPTPVTGRSTDDASEQTLPPFEVPLPEDEDLRGPAKNRDEESSGSKGDEGPIEEPGVNLPSPEALPLFDPQGKQSPELPSQELRFQAPLKEDAPPALPESLRQAAHLLRASLAVQRQQPAASPVGSRPLPQSATEQIRPVNWQQGAIQLINPASAVVVSDSNTLQQAIYYETSDNDLTAETEK